jgi:hypothetical protein
MGPTGCPETSARHYHCLLRNNPEELSFHLLRGGSLILRVQEEGYEAARRSRAVTQNLPFVFHIPSAWFLFCACYEMEQQIFLFNSSSFLC